MSATLDKVLKSEGEICPLLHQALKSKRLRYHGAINTFSCKEIETNVYKLEFLVQETLFPALDELFSYLNAEKTVQIEEQKRTEIKQNVSKIMIIFVEKPLKTAKKR